MNRFRRGFPAPDPPQRTAGGLVALGWLETLADPSTGGPASTLPASISGDWRPTGLPLASRIAPVVIRKRNDVEAAVEGAARTAPEEAVAAASRYAAAMLLGLLHGVALKTAIAPLFEPSRGLWQRRSLSPDVEAAAGGEAILSESAPAAVRALWTARTRLRRRHSFPADDLPAWLGTDGLEAAALTALLAGTAFGEESIPAFDKRTRQRLITFSKELAAGSW